MYFSKPFYSTEDSYVKHLAPIPMYVREFTDHEIHNSVFEFGFKLLSDEQKRMGQELPDQFDTERQSTYESNYQDEWVEQHEFSPIGSRYWTPPNDFLDQKHPLVRKIRSRVEEGFKHLASNLGHEISDTTITESWMQFYDPYAGRGHNAHNHCRWQSGEERPLMFSGGYYLSDGEPVKDHPYSGAFAFHIRGQQYFIRPKKGLLMIWPYDIVHSVKPFYGKSHRCVINFNIQN